MPEQDDRPFLSRWAWRKQAAQRIEQPDGKPQDPPEVSTVATDKPTSPAAPTDAAGETEPAFDPATLPKVEDLTAESDITGFLRKGVPEELKRLALRRVWSLDPQIRDFVEIAENQYDWNAVNGVPGFGALPAGTDIQALLAQATGQLRKIVAPPEATTLAEARQAGHRDTSAPVMQDPPENEFVDARAEVAGSPVAAPELVSTAMVEPVPRISRRRHGGALPQPGPSALES